MLPCNMMWHATLCSDVLLYTDHMFVYRLISVIPNICVSFVSVDLFERSCRVYCTDVFYLHSVPCFVSAHCLDLSWKSCICVDERGTLIKYHTKSFMHENIVAWKLHAWTFHAWTFICHAWKNEHSMHENESFALAWFLRHRNVHG